jgi:NADH-quinone oxidoreductase subunit E
VREEIDHWVAKFPPDRKRSAVIAALHAAQHENHGFLTPSSWMRWPSTSAAAIQVYEVASSTPCSRPSRVGRHHVSGVHQYLLHAARLAGNRRHVEKKLGIKTGESTPDGRIFLKREEECLAACTGAPMMMVDHVFHENLTPEKHRQIWMN